MYPVHPVWLRFLFKLLPDVVNVAMYHVTCASRPPEPSMWLVQGPMWPLSIYPYMLPSIFDASPEMLSAIIKFPFIFGIGLFLTLLAIPTTFLAFGILAVKSLVMVRYFLFPRHKHLIRKPTGPITPAIPEATGPPPARPRSRRTSVSRRSSIIQDPDREISRPPSAAGSAVSLADADFEGVGGWRLPHEASWNDDDEALYIGSGIRNSPSIPRRRHHRRTGTGNSSIHRTSGYTSPETARTPFTPMGHRRNISGTASPENYFSYLPASGSTTTLNAGDRNSRVSFELNVRSSRSSAQSSAQSSAESLGAAA